MKKTLLALLLCFVSTFANAQTASQLYYKSGNNQIPVSSSSPLPIGVFDSTNHSGYCYTSNGSSSSATFQACGSSGSSILLGTSTSSTNPHISGDLTTGLYTAGAGKVDVAISGVNQGEFSSSGFTANVGSSTAISTGTSTARTLAERFATTINVKDKGAVCDGSTNDTTALQAAITQAVNAGSAAVYIPAGSACVQVSPLTISGSGTIEIYGEGKSSQLLAGSGFSGNGQMLVTSTGNVILKSFYLNSNSASGMATGDTLAALSFSGSGVTTEIDHMFFSSPPGNAVFAGTGTGQVNIHDSIFSSIGDYAFSARSGSGIEISNNTINGAGGGGVYVNTFSGASPADRPAVITGNLIFNVTDAFSPGTGQRGNGIQVYNGKKVTITGNFVQNPSWSCIRTNTAYYIDITGNQCIEAGEVAIFSEFASAYTNISGNMIQGFDKKDWSAASGFQTPGISITNLQTYNNRMANVTGNTIVNGTWAAIYVEGDTLVSSNLIDGVAYGIVSGVNQYNKDNVIQGNKITDRFAPTWAQSTVYRAGVSTTANGNIYYTSAGGTSSNSGTGPSGTGSSISDGTVTWSFTRTATPLRVGIWPSASTSAQGYTYIRNNTILDTQVATIQPQIGNPQAATTWSSGSKIFLSENYPGITSTYLPTTGAGGDIQYLTDTGAMQWYDAVAGQWNSLKPPFSVANGGTGDITLTANGVLYGNGTSAVQATAQGGANTILTANAGAPSFSASPTIGTSLTTPLVVGGTATSSTLTLESTSGSGATDAIIFKTASQSEKMRISTNGNIGIGTNNPGALFTVGSNAFEVNSSGTVLAGAWNGTLVSPTYGGTGVNNGSSTFTIGGNTTFSGAFTFTGTLTGNTSVTFPTSGTLSTTTGTVTSVTFTGDGTVLSSTPSSAVTSSGSLTATLASFTAQSLLGNGTSGSATPTQETSPVVSGSMTAASFIPSGSTIPSNGMYLSTANGVSLSTNSGLRFTVDGSAIFNFNGSTTQTQIQTNVFPKVQIKNAGTSSTLYPGVLMMMAANDNTVIGANWFAKSRSTSLNGNTIVQNGDSLGASFFMGANGTGYDIAAEILAQVDATPGSSADMPGRLLFYTTADGSATPSERMRINNAGNIGIGTNNPGSLLTVGSSGQFTADTSGNLATSGTVNFTNATLNAPNLGTSSAATTGTLCWTTSTGLINVDTITTCLASLEELKDKHGSITGALEIVNKLEPFWFTWKTTTPEWAGDKYVQPGLGAHQVESVDKRLVAYGTDGKLKGVRYQEMTAVLTSAVKELNQKVDKLAINGDANIIATNDNVCSHFNWLFRKLSGCK